MYKLCKTEQSARRQRELEMGLLAAMLNQRYEEISISDLCDRLEIPRKSFYRYFASKDGALFALLDHSLLEFEHFATETRPQKKGTALGELEMYFEFWYSRKNLLDALQSSHKTGLLVERATAYALAEHRMPVYLQNLTEKVKSMWLTFCICGLLALVFQWHREGFLQTPAEMAKIASAMLTKPLIP